MCNIYIYIHFSTYVLYRHRCRYRYLYRYRHRSTCMEYIYMCTAVIISFYNQQSHGDMSHHVPATWSHLETDASSSIWRSCLQAAGQIETGQLGRAFPSETPSVSTLVSPSKVSPMICMSMYMYASIYILLFKIHYIVLYIIYIIYIYIYIIYIYYMYILYILYV